MTPTDILFPPARLVWGDVYEPQTKDADGNLLIIKNGPNAGQPGPRWAFGIAIPKGSEGHWAETEWGAKIWAAGHTQNANALNIPTFAWKVTDGDSTVPNTKGRAPSETPHNRGHWIVSLSSSYAPSVWDPQGQVQHPEKGYVKAGYYIQVFGNVVPNGSAQKPGVFINHKMVSLQGEGEVIVSGADAASVGFGQAALPAGARPVTPTPAQAVGMGAPGTPPPPPVPGNGHPAPPPPPATAAPSPSAAGVAPAPSPAATPAPPAPTAVAPNYNPMNPPAAGPGAPPPPPGAAAAPPPPPAPVAAGPVMTPLAIQSGYSYESLKGAGYSDDQMRAAGYLV